MHDAVFSVASFLFFAFASRPFFRDSSFVVIGIRRKLERLALISVTLRVIDVHGDVVDFIGIAHDGGRAASGGRNGCRNGGSNDVTLGA